jgi:hypothetical protein
LDGLVVVPLVRYLYTVSLQPWEMDYLQSLIRADLKKCTVPVVTCEEGK